MKQTRREQGGSEVTAASLVQWVRVRDGFLVFYEEGDGGRLHVEVSRGDLEDGFLAHLAEHKYEIAAECRMQPNCDRCGGWPDRAVKAYWGEVFCGGCRDEVTEALWANDAWPIVEWSQEELAALAGNDSEEV